ncbi:GDSL-type esterase/lipase family protein [Diaminobutyricibacter sp. McL0608]|uniref:GDSL-type esterase/lipase family protein n=1 Tax=Leifsonia sp. McL0608 TaxID=3143537 RepID=UPI0031F2DC9B
MDCTHTASSYPLLLDRLPSVHLVSDVSCSGATTTDVVTSQIGALNRSISLVTVTAGANDLDVAGLQAVCAANPASATCAAAIQARQAQLPALFANLVSTYSLIAAASPNALILVIGYAPLVSTGPLNTAEQALNSTIQGAASTAAAQGAHIRYVAVSFTGHTVDSPHPWFVLAGPNIFHPTWQGNLAYAASIAGSLLAVINHR